MTLHHKIKCEVKITIIWWLKPFSGIGILTGLERGVGTTILELLSRVDLHQRKSPVKAAPIRRLSSVLYWFTKSCTSDNTTISALKCSLLFQGNYFTCFTDKNKIIACIEQAWAPYENQWTKFVIYLYTKRQLEMSKQRNKFSHCSETCTYSLRSNSIELFRYNTKDFACLHAVKHSLNTFLCEAQHAYIAADNTRQTVSV